MWQKINGCLLASGCLLLLLACGQSHSIVGKWRAVGESTMIWTFESDGSIREGDVRRRYRFGDSDRIKIETPFATGVYRVDVAGDHLTLTDSIGVKLEFVRVQEHSG